VGEGPIIGTSVILSPSAHVAENLPGRERPHVAKVLRAVSMADL
jgi:hypothetical protein